MVTSNVLAYTRSNESDGRHGCLGIGRHGLDVGEPVQPGVLPGHCDVRRVRVQAANASARRDGFRQQVEDSARAAANVDGSMAGQQADPVQ